MDSVFSSCEMLESTSQHESSEPCNLPLEYLRNITNNFSDDRLLGEGGFGTVYKGVLPNGETVAVKKLNSSILPGIKDKQFQNEACHLMRLKHPNILLLLGWCTETENIYVEYNGKHICAQKHERLLCLEYMPKGNLRQHLLDESSGLTWETRYKIIEGICYGLHYLHEESQLNAPIVHMDLKPANILLDKNMVPKIADFGLSRLFSEDKTWTCTTNRDGTLGYMAPEYINRGLISTKSDIFSLGVIIIEIVTGQRDYPDESETEKSSQEFTDNVRKLISASKVLKNWRHRLQKSLEIYSQQIRRCIQIGLDCVKLNRSKRPTISQVIKMLKETESAVQSHPALIDDNQDSNRNALQQYAQGPSDGHIEQMYHGSNFQQDTGGTAPSNYFEGDGRVDDDSQLYQPDGDALPGIEGFQIAGEPRPGYQLTACGFPTNGTTLCTFQWVRHLENGTRQSIEGATMYDYVVTADDVGTLLAADCTPMDDNGRQGDLVTEFANNGNKITCDWEMKSRIDAYVSCGRAEFEVHVLAYSPEEWELATLVLTRPNYQIKSKKTGDIIIDEKYSQSLQMKIPNGRTTEFVLVTAGATLPLNTHGISENEDDNVRLRDLIVLVMRTFQKKALDAKRKGKA